jgi:sarcosine oxidase, subunit beta
MVDARADSLVVGAGLAGVATAYHLARRGLRVLAFEDRTPAAGATGRAAGILSEQLWDRWDVEVVRESREEYAALAARSDPGACRTNGFVRWASGREAASALEARSAELRSWGVDVRSLTAGELTDLIPAVRAADLSAIAYAPNDGVIAPTTLADRYVQEGRASGVDWSWGAPVARLVREPEGWSCTIRGRRATAPIAVVAAGAWSKRLLEATGFPLPLCPYRTQAAVLDPGDGAPASLPSFHDLDADVYARPEENGRILAGDGTERAEADPETFVPTGDPSFVAHLAETFGSRLPGWEKVRLVRAWAGVCVSTPDRRPLIGPVVGAPGLHVLSGFNGFGVMRAAGAASRLAEAIVGGGAASERLTPVLPSRFSGEVRPFAPRPGFTVEAGDDPKV